MPEKTIKRIFGFASFLIPFVVYLLTLAPTVTFIDSGELATVAVKLGVAHPTGYPLFTIIGNLFAKLPIGEEIYRLNLMCAVLSSLACVMFFYLMSYLLDTFRKEKTGDKILIYILSFTSALVLAFSKTFWDTANAIEVYSLHSFFIVLNLYVFIRANEEQSMKWWMFFGVSLGLSFTNHLSTIFLSVGFLYYFFAKNGFNKNTFFKIGYIALPFVISLSVYGYLFVRADNPVISWGHPDTFDNFYRHISGKQFSVWMFTSSENASKQFSHFTSAYPKEFFYIPLIVAVFGIMELFKRNAKLFYFTLLLFVFNILYAINYDIYDIDSYFMLAYMVTAVWFGFGVYRLYNIFNLKRELAYAFLLIPVLLISQNYAEADESKNYFVKDYTMNIFKSADTNSIIISHQWDFWVSASMYFQHVKGIRKDIAVIDKELMRKSWYIWYIRDNYPDVYNRSKAEFDALYNELKKFEQNTERYTAPKTEADRADLMRVQTAFLNVFNSLVDKNYQDKSIYTTYEIESEKQEAFGRDYQRVPQGMLIKYTKNKNFEDKTISDFNFIITDKEDYHRKFIMTSYFNAFLSQANYLMNFNQFDKAEEFIRKAMEVQPSNNDARLLLNKLNQLRSSK